MPLPVRKVEPVFVSRGNLPDKYKITDDLEAEAQGTLKNVILQLSSLSHHAEEIFGGLVRAATDLSNKSINLKTRLNLLNEQMYLMSPDVEECSLQDCVNKNVYQSSAVFDQQVVSRSTMPAGMLKKLNSCGRPPPLENLNVFRDDGKDGLKYYSDPNYFFDLWREQVLKDAQIAAEKPHKPKKEGGRQGKKSKPVRAPQNRGQKHKHQAIEQGEHFMPTVTSNSPAKPLEVGDGVIFMPDMPVENQNSATQSATEDPDDTVSNIPKMTKKSSRVSGGFTRISIGNNSKEGPARSPNRQSTDRATLPPPPPPPGVSSNMSVMQEDSSQMPQRPLKSSDQKGGANRPPMTLPPSSQPPKARTHIYGMEDDLPPPPPAPDSFDQELDLLMETIQGLSDFLPTTDNLDEMLPPPLPLGEDGRKLYGRETPSPPPPFTEYGDNMTDDILPPPPPLSEVIYDAPFPQPFIEPVYATPVPLAPKAPLPPAPPPPPPLIPDFNSVPPPPSMPVSARASIGNGLSGVKPLKATVAPPPKVDPRSELLNAIRGGINLKKVENNKKEVKTSAAYGDVASILDGLRKIRVAVEVSDSESDSSEGDSDWSGS